MKSVSFNSELCKFGIGLFETIRVEKEIMDLDLHMNRLFNSIEKLNLKTPYDKLFFTEKIKEYVKNNNIENRALRLTVFDEGYNISIRDISYDEDSYKRGFKLNISPIKRGDSIIYRHKTTNYYESMYTKRYAVANNFDDGIFLNTENVILECSLSNIYFIKNNTIYTPSSKLPLLNGTMKERIFKTCKDLNIDIVEKSIKIDDIKEYEFVFVSNSLMKVMKVTQIEDIKFNNSNEIFDKLKNELFSV